MTKDNLIQSKHKVLQQNYVRTICSTFHSKQFTQTSPAISHIFKCILWFGGCCCSPFKKKDLSGKFRNFVVIVLTLIPMNFIGVGWRQRKLSLVCFIGTFSNKLPRKLPSSPLQRKLCYKCAWNCALFSIVFSFRSGYIFFLL